MTKGERRRMRQVAHVAGEPLVGELAIRQQPEGEEFGAERLRSGRVNVRRERALNRWARRCYEYDRD